MSLVQLNQEATTSQMIPAIVRDALEASMRTTIGITSGITQSFRPIQYQTNLLPIITIKRNKLGEQQRITLMLITIVIAFVLLQLPSIVPTITINLINAGIIQSTQYTTNYANEEASFKWFKLEYAKLKSQLQYDHYAF
ncbi:hypothetical protein Smp_127860 [Schistosoma mansoni]|uniref:hypothetical protein n=1 Tax=Schistosoma mansoni TaxID=6183 RepID=UPI0001A639D0|nr:hypothetical protein Smp_127860 [Schistosoma mansoni]|eukprot:XP_018653537.1 hypothetical protein Smp_127860 [Schistosoma mansoni]